MKITKLTILAAGAILAQSAQAQVNIYITGAVAFRDQAYKTITNLYGATLVAQNVDTPSKPQNSLRTAFTGTIPSLFGAQTVNIYTYYNGAVAGIQNLVQNVPASFYSSTSQGVTTTVSAQADLAFSSAYQKSTVYTTPVLNDTIFGATPVVWVKSTNAPAGLTNITSQQIRLLAANGYLPISVFNGDTNNQNPIYLVNRDSSAGQRVIAYKEAGFTGTPTGYYNSGSGWAANPTGQTSTGPIVSALLAYGPAISYLTPTDASSLPPSWFLSYNGVLPFRGSFSTVSNDFTPVITGQYSLWGYEHILSRTTASGNIVTFLNALVSGIQANLNTSAYSIPFNRLQVVRNADGGVVSPQ